jgi:acetyl-CoA synthetase
LQPLLDGASDNSVAEIMDSEDPLFILYLGSTGKPKEWFTPPLVIWFMLILLKVFNYEENDIFWCTADIGWITGHSYILYGLILKGQPDFSRFFLGNYRNIKWQFYGANSDSCSSKRVCPKTSFKTLKSL